MKITTIAHTNSKGQLVIPQSLRKKLNITPKTPINISIAGKSIFLHPIHHTTPTLDTQDSYLSILKMTQGAWADSHKNQENTELELIESQARKKPW